MYRFLCSQSFFAKHISLCNELANINFTVLRIGVHIQFYEPHRTFRDDDAIHRADIVSIVEGECPLALSTGVVLPRHNRGMKVKVLPGHREQ